MKVVPVVKFMFLVVLFDVATGNEYCDKEFRKRGFIPKYAKGLKSTDLEVRYGKLPPAKCGETVSLIFGDTIRAPTLKFDVAARCDNLIVLLFIPDNFLYPPYLMWLVHNIPSKDMKEGWSNGGALADKLQAGKKSGDVKSAYDLPKSPDQDLGLGNKTLVFFVYCQCHYIEVKRQISKLDRTNLGPAFNVTSYAAKHGLKCPVSGLLLHSSETGLVKLPQIVKVPPVKLAAGVVPPLNVPVPTK